MGTKYQGMQCCHCGWETRNPERFVSGCLAAWHVYEEHPEIWLSVIGSRPPSDPDPRIPSVRMRISGN